VRVDYPARSAACLCFLVLLMLAACGRPAPEATRSRDTGQGIFSAAISNPWSAAVRVPDPADPPQESPVAFPASREQALSSLGSPDPGARRIALDAWMQFRPDSLQEISHMLDDPDISVRTRARVLWNAALSGGREADPQ
jgi:hypothetical protein